VFWWSWAWAWEEVGMVGRWGFCDVCEEGRRPKEAVNIDGTLLDWV